MLAVHVGGSDFYIVVQTWLSLWQQHYHDVTLVTK